MSAGDRITRPARTSHVRPSLGHRFNLPGLLVVAAAVGVWEVVVRTRLIDLQYVSAPSEVVGALRELAQSGALADDTLHTLGVAVRAFLVAAVLGTLIGIALGLIPWVRAGFTLSIDVLRTLPVLALFPVVVIRWGPSSFSEIVVAAWSASWPVILNTSSGVRNVSQRLRDVARVFHLSGWRTVRTIVIPASMGPILVGYRLAAVSALIVAIVAEMIINPQGIGWGLALSAQSLRPDQMWAYVVVAATLGYVVNAALIQVVRRALPGSPAMSADA